MPRKEQGWITFQTSPEEREILEEFCQESQRTKTEILRELVRSLNQHSSTSLSSPHKQDDEQEAQTQKLLSKTRRRKKTSKQVDTGDTYFHQPEIEINNQKKSLKVSSRNVLKGIVKRVVNGSVNSEITLEIVQKVELTSMITRVSAEELELYEGQEAYAIIKSNDIVIARE
ncbi:TOBE domain-containing protein [Tolypothrix tenuis PCC 7101]|uniref:TOBE domain-containing protein n=1 Tax=Tolypothrix tenuis PCC 7101 TaxID=231146 RepID=A0A1Z4N2H3_9CYAN|nr:TOBE domain-containing protein [Aulosira sp. FACHB-113]BAY99926.1 TOBE domain-containing protein [Tolypothrix tenuis PCC 7101]BAZ76152.1 TOBE domain-containing protein [Aulosira laxa NIES-50]